MALAVARSVLILEQGPSLGLPGREYILRPGQNWRPSDGILKDRALLLSAVGVSGEVGGRQTSSLSADWRSLQLN